MLRLSVSIFFIFISAINGASINAEKFLYPITPPHDYYIIQSGKRTILFIDGIVQPKIGFPIPCKRSPAKSSVIYRVMGGPEWIYINNSFDRGGSMGWGGVRRTRVTPLTQNKEINPIRLKDGAPMKVNNSDGLRGGLSSALNAAYI